MSAPNTKRSIEHLITANEDTLHFIYRGKSMRFTLRNGDVLAGHAISISNVRVGDIVVFRNLEQRLIIHRVIAVSSSGLLTRGDACALADKEAVTAENLVARVDLLICNGKHRRLWCGGIGYSRAVIIWACLHSFRSVRKRVLGPMYHALKRLTLLRSLVNRIWHPGIEIICFTSDNGLVVKVMSGSRRIAEWTPLSDRLLVHKPYDLLFSEHALADIRAKTERIVRTHYLGSRSPAASVACSRAIGKEDLDLPASSCRHQESDKESAP